MEILLVNKAISILVNHVESFLELLDLGLIKHSEYIGSRPLGTLLGSLRLGLFAGHGGGMKGACACVCLCASPVICAVGVTSMRSLQTGNGRDPGRCRTKYKEHT